MVDTAKQFYQARDSVRQAMLEHFNAVTLCWEIDGPPDTSVELIQCWALGDHRLVIVESFKDGGCEVFPQVKCNGWISTAEIVEGMKELEQKSC